MFACSVLFGWVPLDFFCTHIALTQPVGRRMAYLSTSIAPSFPESPHETSGWNVFPADSHLSPSPLLISKAGDFASYPELKLSQSAPFDCKATGFLHPATAHETRALVIQTGTGDGGGLSSLREMARDSYCLYTKLSLAFRN